jgi:hypothetical protein
MKTKVESLDDLKAERARLNNEVQLSQVHIQKDLGLIKKEVRPVHQTVNFLGNFLKNKNTGVLGMGVNFAADMLLRRTLLARANPVVRWLVPVLFRNLSGNLLAQSSSKVSEAAVKALTWVKDKTADPQPGGTAVVATPRPPAKPSKPLAWQGLNLAEKMVRWVKDKTADRADVVETVRGPRRTRRVDDVTSVEYLD